MAADASEFSDDEAPRLAAALSYYTVFSLPPLLILLIGGPIGVYMLWYTRGRDVETPVVAEYITEPPGDLPAAIVGALIDEHAETKDIIAGILDLAQRGDLPVTIRADARTSHQSVVTVMDIAGKMGFVNITIVTANQGVQ